MDCDALASTESPKLLQTVMNTVLDGLITIDSNGTIETFNAAASRIFGYRDDEVIGRNVRMLMPEPYRSEHNTYLANYVNGGAAKVISWAMHAMAQSIAQQ